jgi:hypothetical protein
MPHHNCQLQFHLKSYCWQQRWPYFDYSPFIWKRGKIHTLHRINQPQILPIHSDILVHLTGTDRQPSRPHRASITWRVQTNQKRERNHLTHALVTWSNQKLHSLLPNFCISKPRHTDTQTHSTKRPRKVAGVTTVLWPVDRKHSAAFGQGFPKEPKKKKVTSLCSAVLPSAGAHGFRCSETREFFYDSQVSKKRGLPIWTCSCRPSAPTTQRVKKCHTVKSESNADAAWNERLLSWTSNKIILGCIGSFLLAQLPSAYQMFTSWNAYER